MPEHVIYLVIEAHSLPWAMSAWVVQLFLEDPLRRLHRHPQRPSWSQDRPLIPPHHLLAPPLREQVKIGIGPRDLALEHILVAHDPQVQRPESRSSRRSGPRWP